VGPIKLKILPNFGIGLMVPLSHFVTMFVDGKRKSCYVRGIGGKAGDMLSCCDRSERSTNRRSQASLVRNAA